MDMRRAVARALVGFGFFLAVLAAVAAAQGQEPCCRSWTPAMTGGPASHQPHVLTMRWLGTMNVELTYRGQVILLSAYFDPRGKGQLDIGLTAGQVARVDALFFGHEHLDHTKDGAAIAKKTGAPVFGNMATIARFRSEGVPESQLRVVNSGDLYQFEGFTVQPFRMLHSDVGELTEDYWGHTPGFWATAYGAIDSWNLGLMKQLQALGDNLPPPALACPASPPVPHASAPLPGPIDYAYLFTFDDDFRFVYYDSMNWSVLDEAKSLMQQIGGSVDVAMSGYAGPGPQHAVPYAMPAVKLFNPRYWLPGHHDALSIVGHQPLLPMFYQIRKDLPGTEPVFLEMGQPLCFDVHRHVRIGG
jgi:L-ascorbate metabolism protein UlaG (beta-lactamase superfamily)